MIWVLVINFCDFYVTIKMKFVTSLVILAAMLISVSSAYRILAVFPMNTKSHFVIFESLLKALAKRGHQVDVVSHFPRKNPIKNYNDIISFKGMMKSPVNSMTVQRATNLDFVTRAGTDYGNFICDFMANEEFQKLVKNPPKDPPYDLVLTQVFSDFLNFNRKLFDF